MRIIADANATLDTMFKALLGLANLVAMFWISRVTGRMDKLETTNKEQTAALVKEQMAAVELKLQTPLQLMAQSIEAMAARLERGDGEFDVQQARNTELKIAIETRLAAMKDWIRENMASKADLQAQMTAAEKSRAHMEEQLNRLNTSVAVMASHERRDQ